MRVLVTVATTSVLLGGTSKAVFPVPATLRDRTRDELKPSAKQEAVLALTDELEQAAIAYNSGLESTIEVYVQQSQPPANTAKDLIALMEPLDEQRQSTLVDIVKIRQEIRDLLSRGQWAARFGRATGIA